MVKVRLDFGLDPILSSLGQYQKTALGTSMLECSFQKSFDQFLQENLARNGLRYFDYGREIKKVGPRFDRPFRAKFWLVLSQVRKELIELPHLAISSPAQIAATRVLQV